VVQDSSGNAGASIATYARKANIHCDIYVPADTSKSKTTQILAMGANIFSVQGNRKETAAQAFEAAKKSYYASHCFNPYFFHGTKTFAYEICEQLNWNAPDSIVLPAGNGTLIIGSFIGFKELFALGIISKIPKIIAVQSTNCDPINRLLQNPNFNSDTYEAQETIAEGIAIPNPIRAKDMLEAISATYGKVISVTETDIILAWKEMSQKGYFIEPTVIETTDPKYTTMCEEIFGPVLTIYTYPATKFEKTLDILNSTSKYALTGSIISQDRASIELATQKLRHAAGNFYINDKPTGAVVGQQPFGGARASGTNDKAGSMLNLYRWLSARTIKETFNPPTDYKYPFLNEA
jgi:hypothetical protein